MATLSKIQSENSFDKSINHFTLRFKNITLEKEYMEERSQTNQYYKLVMLSAIFSCFFISLRILQTFFQYKFEVVNYKSNINNLLYFSIGCFIGLILEVFPICCYRLRWFKGYCMTIPGTIFGLIQSYQINIDYNNIIPGYPPIFICFAFAIIGISLIYCHNWICGEILILIVIILCEIYINIYPWNLMDKLFLTFEHLFSLITVSTCIRFLEYKRRESFFRIYSLNQLIQTTNMILTNLPDALVVVENNKIIFVNKLFESLCNDIFNLNLINGNIPPSSKIFIPQNNKYINSFFPATLANPISNEAFLSFIENSKEIGDQNQFSLNHSSLKRVIPFEIKSTLIVSTNGVRKIVYSLRDMSTYQELNEMKSRQKYSRMFLTSVSHEFRTPINMIIGNLELLEFKLQNKMDNEIKCYIENSKNSSTFLFMLVQDIIDFSMLKEKKFKININQVNIRALIQDTVNLFQKKFEDKGLYLKTILPLDISEVFRSDELRIKQVLFNFLSNAWKFTIRGGVSVNLVYNSSLDFIEIEVRDTGIGISREDIPKLMKPFVKLEDKYNLNTKWNWYGTEHLQKNFKIFGRKN